MKRNIVPSVVAVFTFISGVSAQMDATSSEAQKLIGTWKLVSFPVPNTIAALMLIC